MKIKFVEVFTDMPGGRFKAHGAWSAEEFRDTILIKKYLEAKRTGQKLQINLDGAYGYSPAFLEEAFGGLVRKLRDKLVLHTLEIITEEFEDSKDFIEEYIIDASYAL